MGRPSNTAQRRQEIVEAMLEVLAREGYANATTAAIARAAGLAPGLLHYHFKNKREVLVALVSYLTDRLEMRRIRLLAKAGDTPEARLVAGLDAWVERGVDADPRAVAAWVVIGSEAIRDAEVRAVYAAAVGRALGELRKLVAATLRHRKAPTRHASRIAAALFTSIEGSYRIAAAAPGALAEGFAAPMLRATAEALLAAEVDHAASAA